MKRLTVISILVMMVLLMLTACGTPAETPEAQTAPTNTASAVPPSPSPEPTEPEPATEVLTTLVASNPTEVASGNTPQEAVIEANVAAADVEAGRELFNTTLNPICAECHIENPTTRTKGPSLNGFSEVADTRVSGEGAYTYAYNSIRYANQHVLEGYQEDVMPVYDGILTDQEVYELIAYIWSLNE